MIVTAVMCMAENIVKFILEGIFPGEEVRRHYPGPEYWKKLQRTAEWRLTLAGYRIADHILSAADQIEAQRKFVGY